MRPEGRLQIEVCEFIQENYPNIIFHSDISAGMALSIGQAVLNKRLQFSRALPDIYILEARRGYFGLFMELKALTSHSLKKDGTVGNDKHVQEQRLIHQELKKKGYLADFFVGIEECKKAINDYLS